MWSIRKENLFTLNSHYSFPKISRVKYLMFKVLFSCLVIYIYKVDDQDCSKKVLRFESLSTSKLVGNLQGQKTLLTTHKIYICFESSLSFFSYLNPNRWYPLLKSNLNNHLDNITRSSILLRLKHQKGF